MSQRAAKKGEGTLEVVGADKSAISTEGMKNHGGASRAQSWWVHFADAWSAAAGEGAHGRGPVDVFGGIAGSGGA